MQPTMFERYGGFSAISRIVLDLYERLLDDDDIGPFFDDVDMSRIVDHQTKFLASLLGGPATYTDEQIRRVHSHLVIGPEHFTRMTEILAATLADHGFAADDVAEVIRGFEARRKVIVE